MGGREGGQEASRLALQAAWELQIAKRDWLLKIGPEDVPEVLRRIRDHIAAIDRAVAARGAATPGLSGMRTTLTAAVVLGEHLVLGHVGDSRGYLLRAGRLHRLTHDQTMAQLLADVGEIDPSEVSGHHLSHVLTQSLGAGDELAVEAQHVTLADGDRLLLATDGLAAVAEDAELERLLVRTPGSDQAADRLLELALDRGAPDNVTVVVAHVAIPRRRQARRRTAAVRTRARR
jgi:protein phosphatase